MKNKCKTYTFQNIRNFILDQADDRHIDNNSSQPDDLGNVMMHYARKRMKSRLVSIGSSKVQSVRSCLVPVDGITQAQMYKLSTMLKNKNATTYKQAKTIISNF